MSESVAAACIPASFKYVTTIKDHQCEACQTIIKKGSKVLNVHGKLIYYFNEYWCNQCDLDRIDSIPDNDLRLKILSYKQKNQEKV